MSSLEEILPLLRSDLDSDRIQGLLDLIRIRGEPPLELVFHLATEDPSPGVRYYARRAFGALKSSSPPGDTPLPAPLPERLTTIAKGLAALDVRQRRAALQAVKAQPDPGLLPLLTQALHRETVPELRASFIAALGQLGGPPEIDLLAPFLGDRDPRVRANTVEAMAGIGTDEAVLRLLPLVQDPDHRVKANAVRALAGVEGTSIPRLLRQMAREGEIWTRDAALHALNSLEVPFAFHLLGEVATSDPAARLREKARGFLRDQAARGRALARQILADLPPDAGEGLRTPPDGRDPPETLPPTPSDGRGPESNPSGA